MRLWHRVARAAELGALTVATLLESPPWLPALIGIPPGKPDNPS